MSTGAIRAGGGFVELFLKSDKLTAGLSVVENKLKSFSGKVGAVGASLTALSAAFLVPLKSMAEMAADIGDQLKDMSIRTGVSTAALSELAFAAEQTAGDLEMVETSLMMMQKVLAGKNAEKNLKKLGLELSALKGMSPDRQFEAIGDAISKIEDPAKRTSMWMLFFGKQGTQLGNMFENGAKGVREMREEAVRLGLSVSQQHAEEADAYGDAWKELSRVLRSAKMAIGQALIPSMTEMIKLTVRAVIPAIQWIKANRELFLTIAKVATVVSVVGTALAGLAAAGLTVVGIVAGLKAVMAGVAAVFAFLVTPIGAVIAGAAAMAVGFVYLTGIGASLLQAIQGIALALGSGQWALAGKIAMASLQLAFVSGLALITDQWVRFKFAVLSIVNSLADGIANIWGLVVDQIAVEMVGLKHLVGAISEQEMSSQISAIKQDRRSQADNEAAKQQRELDIALAEELGAYDEKKEKLKQEIRDLLEQAKAPFGRKKLRSTDDDYPIGKALKNGLKSVIASENSGTFSGFAARMMGQSAPAVNERIAAASEETNDLLKDLIGKVDGVGIGQ